MRNADMSGRDGNVSINATKKEAEAIDALKFAIRALPRTIHITVDDFDGTIEFWKRRSKTASIEVSTPLKCRRALVM